MVYGAALAGQMYLWLWGLTTLSTLRYRSFLLWFEYALLYLLDSDTPWGLSLDVVYRVLMLTQYANIWMVAVLAALVGKRSSSQVNSSPTIRIDNF